MIGGGQNFDIFMACARPLVWVLIALTVEVLLNTRIGNLDGVVDERQIKLLGDLPFDLG